jgi:RNA polymerase sigma-70 factor (ECF subfamily)
MKALKALTPDEESDESLMVRVANGDRQAFTRLVRRHSGRFFAHAWRMTGNRAEAEDCVQDSFLKLWRNPGAFDPGRGNKFTTWFYRVVTNAAIDLQRRRRETPDTDGLERMTASAPLQDRVLEEERQAQALEAAIQDLPERQKTALNLCFYEGISNADAARIMEINVKALESLLMRAKKTLKQKLGRDGWLDKKEDDDA